MRVKTKIREVAKLVSISGLAWSLNGCAAGSEAEDLSEATGVAEQAFDVGPCAHFNAWDTIRDGGWSHQAIHSNAVDLGLGVGNLYNAYNYDYSKQCPDTFVTDLEGRPSGDAKHTYRVAITQLQDGGAMTPERCGSIALQVAIYAVKFGDPPGTWRHIRNVYFNGEPKNGGCQLPHLQGTYDWKAGISGFGKIGALRIAANAYDNDHLQKVCLAIDPDNSGKHLNSLCPITTVF